MRRKYPTHLVGKSRAVAQRIEEGRGHVVVAFEYIWRGNNNPFSASHSLVSSTSVIHWRNYSACLGQLVTALQASIKAARGQRGASAHGAGKQVAEVEPKSLKHIMSRQG